MMHLLSLEKQPDELLNNKVVQTDCSKNTLFCTEVERFNLLYLRREEMLVAMHLLENNGLCKKCINVFYTRRRHPPIVLAFK